MQPYTPTTPRNTGDRELKCLHKKRKSAILKQKALSHSIQRQRLNSEKRQGENVRIQPLSIAQH